MTHGEFAHVPTYCIQVMGRHWGHAGIMRAPLPPSRHTLGAQRPHHPTLRFAPNSSPVSIRSVHLERPKSVHAHPTRDPNPGPNLSRHPAHTQNLPEPEKTIAWGCVTGDMGKAQAAAQAAAEEGEEVVVNCGKYGVRAKPRFVLCKDDECSRKQHGGQCSRPNGSPGCTWKIDPIGYLTLDEIEGRVPVGAELDSWKRKQGQRANPPPGGVCFWEDPRDPIKCRERVRMLDQLFVQKYPEQPADLDGPRCAY